ncbi:hypothetical protein Tco_0571702 [Tanacetum coccineum]
MSGEELATQIAPVESPQMVSTVKLPMLKKVILNGDGPIQVTIDEKGIETEYQLRFHGIKDAKSLWAAVKSRFTGNVTSKKMQKTVLKQQFENFSVSDIKGLDKAYDMFQINLISLLVFMVQISNSPQLDDEDLEQIDHDDLEEMDLKWQVAMLSMRVKRFYKKTGRKLIFNGKEPVASRNQGNRNGDVGYRSRDNTRRTVPVETSDALVVQDNALIVQDRLGYDWSYIAQDEPTEFALMAYTSNSSGSDTERQVMGDDNQTNDRFKKDNGYHVVPLPLTGNYLLPLADLFFYGIGGF